MVTTNSRATYQSPHSGRVSSRIPLVAVHVKTPFATGAVIFIHYQDPGSGRMFNTETRHGRSPWGS